MSVFDFYGDEKEPENVDFIEECKDKDKDKECFYCKCMNKKCNCPGKCHPGPKCEECPIPIELKIEITVKIEKEH